MRMFTKTISALSISTVLALTSLGSAVAMELPSSNAPQMSAVQTVQFDERREWRPQGERRDWRDRRDYSDRREWRDRREGYYGGHRGYRDYRRGYRRHSDGLWYPLAAFGAGAIIGGAVASPPRRVYQSSGNHAQWCANRYRSYRAYDNTYVPSAGVRAQCVSPYN